MLNMSFFHGKRVFVTGHTGFKGSYLCRILLRAGAEIFGYSLAPTEPCMFEFLNLKNEMNSYIGDIRDYEYLRACFEKSRPELVFHLAAQPIVGEGYRDPRYTYETNVMGTVNLLECIRRTDTVRSFLNVTTDKVYRNDEREAGYRENDVLDGFDPYSNSKSCSELVTHSYKRSFFSDRPIAVSCARSGNAIGGGDFSVERIIPHCVKAISDNKPITLRSPNSVRPYQHVLESVFAYLLIAARQYNNINLAGDYNVGPDVSDSLCTSELVKLFCESFGVDVSIQNECKSYCEASVLRLDSSKIMNVFDWSSVWNITEAVEHTAEWYREYLSGGDIYEITDRQIYQFVTSSPWLCD